MKKVIAGFAFHVHHDRLVEWCTDYDERVKYIQCHKPQYEQALRLRLFNLIPQNRVPLDLVKAWEAYIKAGKACDKAWEACIKAGETYDKELEILHQELCPNCPWDGQTIFAKAE